MFLKFQALAILDGNGQGIIAAATLQRLECVQLIANRGAQMEASVYLTIRAAQKGVPQLALKANIMTSSQETV